MARWMALPLSIFLACCPLAWGEQVVSLDALARQTWLLDSSATPLLPSWLIYSLAALITFSLLFIALQKQQIRRATGAMLQNQTCPLENEAYLKMGRAVLEILNAPGELKDLIPQVLSVLKKQSGFDAVGIRLQEDGDFPYISQDGFSLDFLQQENSLLVRDKEKGVCRDEDGNLCLECTCGLVVCGKTDPGYSLFTAGGSFWTNDSLPILDFPPDEDPRLHPRNQCIHQGYASVALVPIRSKEKIIGLIQFNDRKKDRLTLEAVEYLEGIGLHLGSAILRKQSEEALQEERKRLAGIIKATNVGTWEWNVQTGEVVINERWAEIIGYTVDELSPVSFESWTRSIHPDDLERREELLERHFQGVLDSYECEMRMHHKAGRWVWIAARGKVESWTNEGKPLRMFGTNTEISRRKAVEEALLLSQAELQGQNEALQVIQEQLRHEIERSKAAKAQMAEAKIVAEAANSAKSQFLANMSHEIRTPMNGILGMTQLLQLTGLTEEQSEYAAALKLSSHNLMSLMNDILDLSKIEAGKIEIELAGFSLHQCLSDLVLMQKVAVHAKGLNLDLYLPGDLPAILVGDQLRIKQILLNLLGNAVKFTDQGQIQLYVQIAEQHGDVALIKIAVRDSGVGIAPEAIENIFQPFVQEDGTTTRRFGGTGLGLTISRRLAELMGGTLSVDSTPGVGSCFTLTLPLMIDTTTLPATPDATAISEFSWEGPPLRILYAEDDAINTTFGTSLLRKFGHEIVAVKNGRECLAVLEAGPFDLVLMDIHMPVMSGEEALQEIRKKEAESGLHQMVIALTAYAMRGDKSRFLQEGFDGYISKPITARDLLAELQRACPSVGKT